MKFETLINGIETAIELDIENKVACLENRNTPYSLDNLGNGRFLLRTGLNTYILDNIEVNEHKVEFTMNGRWVKSQIKDEQSLLLARLGFKVGAGKSEGRLVAPMPGKILNILVNEGETVKLGTPLVILEAMKMENELKAPTDGTVSKINVSVGDSIEKNNIIMEISPLG